MDDGQLSSSLQESLLTLLVFDPTFGASVAAMVSPNHFEVPYRDIASRTLEYWQRWSKPPGEAHVDDLFDHVLGDPGNRQRQKYQRILTGLHHQSKHLNAEYVANRVTDFITRQTMKAGVLKAAQRYQEGGDNLNEDVRRILLDTLKGDTSKLDPGIFLGDEKRALAFLDNPYGDGCTIGIPEFDRLGIHPVRKELLTVMAPRGYGKSWFLMHIGIRAFMYRWRVLHITLEMSHERVFQRYFQSLFRIAKRPDEYRRAVMVLDDMGRLESLTRKTMHPKLSFQQPNIRDFLQKKIKDWGAKFDHLLIKDFPTGQLTFSKLQSYLDALERVHRFVPDLIIIDYPGIMWTDPKDRRVSLGNLVQNIRGLGVERNAAIVIAHQANRMGEKSGQVRNWHAGEDISVIATADVVVNYSQTEQEGEESLARLTAGKARNDESKFTVLVTQDYHQGQFVIDSVRMDPKRYWEQLGDMTGKKTNGAGDEDDGERDVIAEEGD